MFHKWLEMVFDCIIMGSLLEISEPVLIILMGSRLILKLTLGNGPHNHLITMTPIDKQNVKLYS